MSKKNPIRIPYAVRWGHPRKRTIKGHPKRAARQLRAAARAT